jgi:hypothetical protein
MVLLYFVLIYVVVFQLSLLSLFLCWLKSFTVRIDDERDLADEHEWPDKSRCIQSRAEGLTAAPAYPPNENLFSFFTFSQ